MLREALHLPQQGDVPRRVTTSTAASTQWRDQTQPVVLPEGLGMHAGQLCSDRDHEDRSLVIRGEPAGTWHGVHGSALPGPGEQVRPRIGVALLGAQHLHGLARFVGQPLGDRNAHFGQQVAGVVLGHDAPTFDA